MADHLRRDPQVASLTSSVCVSWFCFCSTGCDRHVAVKAIRDIPQCYPLAFIQAAGSCQCCLVRWSHFSPPYVHCNHICRVSLSLQPQCYPLLQAQPPAARALFSCLPFARPTDPASMHTDGSLSLQSVMMLCCALTQGLYWAHSTSTHYSPLPHYTKVVAKPQRWLSEHATQTIPTY